MSAVDLLGSLHQAHTRLLARSTGQDNPVYLNLVFKAYYLRTTSDFALGYFCLIVLCIGERLVALLIDNIRDKPGQPWRILIRVPLYFLVTMVRYILMIAIMFVNINLFFVICSGLALGQIAVESIRYYTMMRAVKRTRVADNASTAFEPLKNTDTPQPNRYNEPHHTSHLSESCC
ncbi:hypothetical protein GGI04_002468 [Coemansia thaxteri]|uniref:Copper transport protein n=1 Tax=Coemansia thaxteri TaxID=2663907 RepID=A0A9W8BK14_9FUNG|nr:hypothetical protein GGI04_002468 [Coemansia thaxteri]KAJ2005719.1 hypothetical protein H4R26_001804 [Coemansia thaxteri]KAJ2470272.1 hypothetical protein GGI02_003039 [Coemansia sp. RSA 2322]KAJ2478842.1 hypothetical protein EV174_004194 [Coemansia sp. RSA 2320]